MDGTTWAALALSAGAALATLVITSLNRLAIIKLEYWHGLMLLDLEMRRLAAGLPPLMTTNDTSGGARPETNPATPTTPPATGGSGATGATATSPNLT
jgi:hypothetical protein